jgi:anaerobic selenocysteine-containing dehydrogenase
MTKLSRRHFLLLCAAADAGLLLKTSAADAKGIGDFPLHKKVGETTSICPYCSCGCGVLVATNEGGHITNVEGDPDHPTNRGALDPKSLSIRQMSNSPLRLKTVMYRAPGSDQWEVRTWEWATEQIAQRIKQVRDDTFVTTVKVEDKDVTVNRTEGIAWLGGAANNSEDCYLATKFSRALGLVYLEHQARI